MSEPTAEQRARYEQAGRAVHTFVSAGATPLLAAASASSTSAMNPLSTVPAVVFLRQNEATRLALDNALTSIRGAYNQARAAWQAQQWEAAAARMEQTREHCARLYRRLVQVVPAASEVLERAARDLVPAALDGLGFGLGMAGLVLALGLLLVLK